MLTLSKAYTCGERGVLRRLDSMIYRNDGEKCYRKVRKDVKCYKHFSIAEAQSAKQEVTRDDVRGRQVSNRAIPILSTFLIQVKFSHPFLICFEPSSNSLHLPLS